MGHFSKICHCKTTQWGPGQTQALANWVYGEPGMPDQPEQH